MRIGRCFPGSRYGQRLFELEGFLVGFNADFGMLGWGVTVYGRLGVRVLISGLRTGFLAHLQHERSGSRFHVWLFRVYELRAEGLNLRDLNFESGWSL